MLKCGVKKNYKKCWRMNKEKNLLYLKLNFSLYLKIECSVSSFVFNKKMREILFFSSPQKCQIQLHNSTINLRAKFTSLILMLTYVYIRIVSTKFFELLPVEKEKGRRRVRERERESIPLKRTPLNVKCLS
jgi:hypothetical protein